MRTLSRFALPGILAAVAIGTGSLQSPLGAVPDEPMPLLKAVTPPGSSIRVRVPVDTSNMYTDAQIKAQVPKAKGKKGDVIDVTVAFDTLPGKSAVSTKKWQSWGYDVPANKIGVLPEIIIPGTQLAPKVTKGGRDVEVRIPSISVEIVDPPKSDLVYGCDLYLRMQDVTKNADRMFEPRFYFGDKTFEFTVSNNAVKRPGSGDQTPADPGMDSDTSLVPVSGPMVIRGAPVFSYASINGMQQYRLPDGKDQAVDVGVSSNTNWPGGIMMTIGTARGCGIEIENNKDLTGTSAAFETTIAKAKAKEFRLSFLTGPGFKVQKDLVLKDVTVFVDKNNSGHFVWLGTKFMNEQFKDAVYTGGSDGSWRLVGRMKSDLLQDIKTRMPPPKK